MSRMSLLFFKHKNSVPNIFKLFAGVCWVQFLVSSFCDSWEVVVSRTQIQKTREAVRMRNQRQALLNKLKTPKTINPKTTKKSKKSKDVASHKVEQSISKSKVQIKKNSRNMARN